MSAFENWFDEQARRKAYGEGVFAGAYSTGIEKHFYEPEPEQVHPCTACGCPTVNNQYCHGCAGMFVAVADRRWFADAQSEWKKEQERKRAMITGDNYFPGWSG
jgi:hypothetical protein